ncbi:hypothetical protein [Flavobacterium sp.]|uniref:hypothetical protein n=1 Tax=Flavobacterium sp. TaxID=239 RepID=UPI002FDB14AD
MKNLLFVFTATFLFSFNGNAQENNERIESAYLSITSDNEVTTYRFDSIKDLEENSPKILDEISSKTEKNKDDKCLISLIFSFSVSNGTLTKTLTSAITTYYSVIAEETKKIQDELIAIIK